MDASRRRYMEWRSLNKKRMNLKEHSKTSFVLGWGMKNPEDWNRIAENEKKYINIYDTAKHIFLYFLFERTRESQLYNVYLKTLSVLITS